jgi:hypothetical protein
MFAKIGVEGSKLTTFRWMTGKASDRIFRCNYEFTERRTICFGSVLAVRLSSTHQTIKRVLVSDIGMQKFMGRWISHDLSEANRRERVLKANLLLEELRADEGNECANNDW